MGFIECPSGHLYDPSQYAQCPYCNGMGSRIDFNGGQTFDEIGKTAPVSGAAGFGGGFVMDEVGSTVAPKAFMDSQRETGKTVGIFSKTTKNDPVVGWLVCVDGVEKGKDYRIYGRQNTIGRSESMDICIKEDATISRENHARLAYDEKHNEFYLIPAESTNNIYLNDEPVYVPAKLTSYDRIELGETKLLFVPFCSDKFKWEKD